jgi:hypothetical protein
MQKWLFLTVAAGLAIELMWPSGPQPVQIPVAAAAVSKPGKGRGKPCSSEAEAAISTRMWK